MEEKISEVENELHEASEEMRSSRWAGAQSTEGEPGLAGDGGSVSSTGGSKKKIKAVVRREPADTQESRAS